MQNWLPLKTCFRTTVITVKILIPKQWMTSRVRYLHHGISRNFVCLAKSDCDDFPLQLQCCGVMNYTDWLQTPWFNHSGKYEVPQSCCNKTFHSCNGTLDAPMSLYNEVQSLILFELPMILFSYFFSMIS